MPVVQALFPTRPFSLQALVVAYVNEPVPLEGQPSLRFQIKAVLRRARNDGIAIGLLVIDSGGRRSSRGIGERLETVFKAARADPAGRVLYVADTIHLADGPESVLLAIEEVAAADFELRAPCGRISPNGRRVASIRASCKPPRRRQRLAYGASRNAGGERCVGGKGHA